MGLQSPKFVGAASHLEWPLSPRYVQRRPAGVIEWQDYPLAVSGFNISSDSGHIGHFTYTNPDADTLRITLSTDNHGHTLGTGLITDALHMVIPTPIGSFAPPGVASYSSYRTLAGFAVEWDWAHADCESMQISCGLIRNSGASAITDVDLHRFFRKSTIQSTTAQTKVEDIGVDGASAKSTNVSTSSAVSDDTIGTKIIVGAGGRTWFPMSYDWKDASYNKQESNFGDLTANRGSGSFNAGETWDAGTDSIDAENYYFFLGFGGNGNTAGTDNKIDVKRIMYFVHSVGNWYK